MDRLEHPGRTQGSRLTWIGFFTLIVGQPRTGPEPHLDAHKGPVSGLRAQSAMGHARVKMLARGRYTVWVSVCCRLENSSWTMTTGCCLAAMCAILR